MIKLKLLFASCSSGLIMALAWPAIGDITGLIFLAFTPLLYVEHIISRRGGLTGISVFLYAYLAFFVFNLITTYWIYYASAGGAAMAIIFNSLFMAIVFWLFHITKKKVGTKEGYIAFILYWLAFEYLHLNWELSWTWLTFGNVFANSINQVQWYEFTGVLGGSLLVLIGNVLFFKGTLYNKEKGKFLNKYFAWLILMIGLSYLISSVGINHKEEGKKVSVVIVQPNVDPYKEKFNGLSPSTQIDRMVEMAKENVTDKTEYLILPETALAEAHWEHALEYMYATEEFKKLIANFPKLKVVVGLSSSILYTPGMEKSATANEFSDGSGWYDNYNTAIQIDSSAEIPIHHKSKLVLGVEKLPFIHSIPLMKKLSINLGGTSGGLGTQKEPTIFHSKNNESSIAPIICYESIYGEYVTQYSQLGANFFAIITNDGWWDDTPGYHQHLAYARLRAIENRRSIVRSANTGISAIINQHGEILDETKWWEQVVIIGDVYLNDELTFYTKYGDYLGRIAGFVAPLLILLTIVKTLNKTEQRLKPNKG